MICYDISRHTRTKKKPRQPGDEGEKKKMNRKKKKQIDSQVAADSSSLSLPVCECCNQVHKR
jgi:hypothetical protein